MQILNNISLKPYNTFGIDVVAKQFISVSNIDNLKTVLKENTNTDKLILGGGSNMLLTKDYEGLALHINFKGIEIISQNEDSVIVKAQAGENWHEFVLWCLANDFGGLENLSLIPGNVGTTPIQNIGAYGIEIKDTFYSCEALNLKSLEIERFSKQDCKFGYRNSTFKQENKGKYIITSVCFKLSKNNHKLNINYGTIAQELKSNGITIPSIQDISKAVIAIRESKLPNPKDIGNSGSFFKNPVILKSEFETLVKNFPDVPNYPVSDTEVKVPAGWLIEKSGFKGKQFGNYGVHKMQALVLVNYGNAKGSDILKLSKLIQKTVKRLFNITIEAEVNIL